MKYLLRLIMVTFTVPLYANSLGILVRDNTGHPVADVVVYIESKVPLSDSKQANRVEISQKNKAFSPYITVVQKGLSVVFSNQDDINHHIFSASRQQRFSFKIRAGQTKSDILFSQTGKISMGCNIHDWMSGYLLVLDTPIFTKTNALGIAHFKLKVKELDVKNPISNNQITVKIWHPQLNEQLSNTEQRLELTGKQKIVFNLKKPMSSIEPQESGDDFDFLDDY